jgi:hypothetical protein
MRTGGRQVRWGGALIAFAAVLACAASAAWFLVAGVARAPRGTAAELGAFAAAPAALPAPAGCRPCWRPDLTESWQVELSQRPQPPYPPVRMIEVDGFDTAASVVAGLHRSLRGRGVVCYIDAGTWEGWRPDAGEFPRSLLGRDDAGWPGERWLNIGSYQGALARVMRARAAMCKSKGFDAVDFDNVDGYANATGFRLTPAEQLRYDIFLANTAHRLGLAVALKNDLPQIPVLVGYFDFAVAEQCFQYAECTTRQNGGFGLDEFTRAGKAAFDIEYSLAPGQFCPAARRDRVNALRKNLSLDAWRQACP